MSPRSASIAEQNEDTFTLTKPIDLLDSTSTDLNLLESNVDLELKMPYEKEERPTTSGSGNTFDQAERAFADFDGEYVPPRRSISGNEEDSGVHFLQRKRSGDLLSVDNMRRRTTSGDLLSVDNMQRRVSSGDMLSVAGSESNNTRVSHMSMARPQSYADPNTGQQMVYYPAPVPMMLNLPQKLSKMPSSMARNKRRTQVLSSIPAAARQSAIWLPDVLEIEDEPDLPEDDGAQQMEYVAQHQRATMGGRRLPQDVQHLPPQLRANVFFDIPGHNQTVELKEQSAVATLDSILDASAHAPVSAFTDHVFAGHLGAEVYGKPNMRNSRSSTHLLAEEKSKKRTSSFNLLRGRRASSSDLLESENEKRRNTIADIRNGKILRDDEDDDDDADAKALRDYEGESDDEAEEEEEEYVGAPTTLLAELQLRKQQQKHRTRPLASAFPNGLHSTLLELDAVAQVEKKKRYQRRVNLAWEDPSAQEAEDDSPDDEDVPLALLYAKKSQVQEPNRPMGLMERRDMEDNEPLSRRRDRLQGKPMNRASTMMNLTGAPTPSEAEGETLAQRAARLRDQGRSMTGLPTTRPVSGDFASEMMSQFGGDLLSSDPKGKGKEESPAPPEEEETLGQRRKRLQAEKEARATQLGTSADPQRPALQQRRSMADLLTAHPAAGASGNRVQSYGKHPTGLLGLHEQVSKRRSSTMLNLNTSQVSAQGGFRSGMYNDGQGGIVPPPKPQPRVVSGGNAYNMYNSNANNGLFPQPSLGFGYGMSGQAPMMMPYANPYAMNGMGMPIAGYPMPNMSMPMAMNMGMMGTEPLSQGQIDMVERWRQSVMQ